MKKINMNGLYAVAKKTSKEASSINTMIGHIQQTKPHLEVGRTTGFIKNVEHIETENSSRMQLHVGFMVEGRTEPIILKWGVFYDARPNSVFIKLVKELVEDYVIGQPFNKNKLIGKIIDVEIGHLDVSHGSIAIIKDFYGEHEEKIEYLEL